MRGCNYSLRSMLRRMRRFRAGGRPAFHNRAPSSRIRLDANAVIGRLIESAACRQGSVQSFAPKRALKGIGSAPTRLPMRGRAETSPSQIVGRQLRHSDALGGLLHDVPNRLYRHPISPRPSYLIDPAEHLSSIKLRLRRASRSARFSPNRGQSAWPCSAVNQFPKRHAQLLHAFDATNTGSQSVLRRPQSAASYASRRTAPRGRLMVAGASSPDSR